MVSLFFYQEKVDFFWGGGRGRGVSSCRKVLRTHNNLSRKSRPFKQAFFCADTKVCLKKKRHPWGKGKREAEVKSNGLTDN